METLRETSTIWSAETRRTLRSVRAVILLALYALFTTLVILFSGSLSGLTPTANGEAATGEMAEQLRTAAIAWLFSPDPALVESLKAFPLAILITFKITLVFLPFYIAIIGFDQISGEVATKSIRYLNLRARRSSMLLGKFFAQQTVLIALAFVVDLGLLVYARFRFEDFETSTLLIGLLRLWLASVIFSFAYSGLTSLCSAAFRQPVVSLVMNLLFLPPIFLLAKIPAWFWIETRKGIGAAPIEEVITSPLANLRYLSPWGFVDNLLHPEATKLLLSVFAHLGFAALFLAIGYAILRRRDL